jgi:hypothetical protein
VAQFLLLQLVAVVVLMLTAELATLVALEVVVGTTHLAVVVLVQAGKVMMAVKEVQPPLMAVAVAAVQV